MKGLLIKEVYQLKNSMKTQVLTLVLFAGVGILMKSTVYVGMMVTLLVTNMILLTMSYDESSSWKRYAMTTPIRRRDLITVKYVLLYLLAVCSVVFTIIVGIPINIYAEISMVESAATAIGCGLISMWAMSLNILLCTKFGVEKARLMTVLSYLAPFAAIWILAMLSDKGMIDLARLTAQNSWLLPAVIVLVILAASILFWHLSCRIIEKQDL